MTAGATAYPGGVLTGYLSTGTLNGALVGGATAFGVGVVGHFAGKFFSPGGK